MPLYEYRCNDCGNQFETIVNQSTAKIIESRPCPQCKEGPPKRVFGTPAIHMRYSPMHPRHMRGQRR